MSNVTERVDDRRKLTTGPTLSDQAYRALRDEITTGVMKPGQRLTERALADHLGVGMPVDLIDGAQSIGHSAKKRVTETLSISAVTSGQ